LQAHSFLVVLQVARKVTWKGAVSPSATPIIQQRRYSRRARYKFTLCPKIARAQPRAVQRKFGSTRQVRGRVVASGLLIDHPERNRLGIGIPHSQGYKKRTFGNCFFLLVHCKIVLSSSVLALSQSELGKVCYATSASRVALRGRARVAYPKLPAAKLLAELVLLIELLEGRREQMEG
jgi:hypothetical protein